MPTKNHPLDQAALEELRRKVRAYGGQVRVAKAAGVGQSQVSKLLAGSNVTINTAMRIYAALGVEGMQTRARTEPEADVGEEQESRNLQLERELLEMERKALRQHTKIMTAVAHACRVAGLTPEQAHMIQAAVMDYDTITTQDDVLEAAGRYAMPEAEPAAAAGAE